MVTILAAWDGGTGRVDRVDPAWLDPASPVVFWVDLEEPGPAESALLSEVFGFHELAVEDALSEVHHPKIESYGDFLYLILHGIDFRGSREGFATRDTDFFLGRNYLVSVHGLSRSVAHVRELAERHAPVLREGPSALLHRIVDTMVDHYEPEVDRLDTRLDELEMQVFERPGPDMVRCILELKRDVGSLRRITLPQRDAIGRLARREFPFIDEAVAYRFRDVYDHLVRYADQAVAFQDRITTLLDAHLSNISNRLNQVMKVLTLIATIFMPLTVLTGLYGMNVPLPLLPGGPDTQFWWILGMMVALSAVMIGYFRRRDWL